MSKSQKKTTKAANEDNVSAKDAAAKASQDDVAKNKPKKKPKKDRKFAGRLCYERSFDTGNAFMYGIIAGANDPDRRLHPLCVDTVSMRGAPGDWKLAFGKSSEDDLDKPRSMDDAHITRQEKVFLPDGCNGLHVRFPTTISGKSLQPKDCNHGKWFEALKSFASMYRDKGGFDELAARYLWNIVNARWLYRNLINMADVSIKIVHDTGPEDDENKVSWLFDSRNFALGDDYPGTDELLKDIKFKQVHRLIADALSGQAEPLSITIVAEGSVSPGMEIYPSQRFIEGKKGPKKNGEKTCILATAKCLQEGREIEVPVFVGRKINAAIRTIDDWHNEVDEFGILPVELLGYDQHRGEAVRACSADHSSNNVWNILRNEFDTVNEELNLVSKPSAITPDIHYFMACLIRGCVLSMGEENESEEKSSSSNKTKKTSNDKIQEAA